MATHTILKSISIHPALNPVHVYPTPPASPISATSIASTSNPLSTARRTSRCPAPAPAPAPALVIPVCSYPQLRASHVYALKHMISKLRWEQRNNGYIFGEDAWTLHNRIIAKLETELEGAQAAQTGLDRFANCASPMTFPKVHGPQTRQVADAEREAEGKKREAEDRKLDGQLPWLKQLFIGPRTKKQAYNDRMLRDQLKEGDFEDVSALLPSENMRRLMGQVQKKRADHKAGEKRKSYEQVRYDKERAKIAKAMLPPIPSPSSPAAAAAAAAPSSSPDVAPLPAADSNVKKPTGRAHGPITYSEHVAATLPTTPPLPPTPTYGPKTREEQLLPQQREQRQLILNWLRRSWSSYNVDAAPVMEKLSRLAYAQLELELKEERAAKKQALVKAT